MQNPQQGMEQMFGNNPVFQQARKMAEGKSPEQMKETVSVAVDLVVLMVLSIH
jgi:hypothetical protein